MVPSLPFALLVLLSSTAQPPDEDVLGELVVEASPGEDPRAVHRTRVALRSDEPALGEVLDVLTRDLELTGMLVVVPLDAATRPDRIITVRSDGRRWIGEIVSERGPAAISGVEEAGPSGPARAHRFADALTEALTGVSSDFSGRLAVVRRSEGTRRLFIATTDGDARALSGPEVLVSSVGFDPEGRLYWTASTDRGPFELWREGSAGPTHLQPGGSVYGFAFHEDRFAAAIADGSRIQLWEGSWGDTLRLRSRGPASVAPAFASRRTLATIEDRGGPPRVMLGRRAVSRPGRVASALTVCRDPATARARLVWVEQGTRVALVFSRPLDGAGIASVLWSGRGSVRSMACSPDGRTLALGYDGPALRGPGTYLLPARDGLWPDAVRIDDGVATGLAWGPRGS